MLRADELQLGRVTRLALELAHELDPDLGRGAHVGKRAVELRAHELRQRGSVPPA